MAQFKRGDRVVLLDSKTPVVATIIGSPFSWSFTILFDERWNGLTGLASVHENHLISEDLYNSPLYKALR